MGSSQQGGEPRGRGRGDEGVRAASVESECVLAAPGRERLVSFRPTLAAPHPVPGQIFLKALFPTALKLGVQRKTGFSLPWESVI